MKKQAIIRFSIVILIAASSILLATCSRSKELKDNRTPYKGRVMNGIPASQESQVTLSNAFEQPYNKWSFANAEIFSNLMVARGGEIFNFPRNSDISIEQQIVDGTDNSVLELLMADNTDGIIVIKDGEIRYERYFNDFKPNQRHIWASSTKGLTALSAAILVEQGILKLDKHIEYYLPEMKGSAFDGLTVQQVLNMVSAIDYSEDYVDMQPGTIHYEYFRRVGLIPAFDLMMLDPKESEIPRGNLALLNKMQRNNKLEPGQIFEYHSPNVDVIGLIIQRLSKQPFNEFVSEHIWTKIGAEHDAAFLTDVAFNPIATGGFMSTLGDFAKYGYVVLNNGQFNGEQIFPADFIQNTYKLASNEYEAGQNSIYRANENSPAFDKRLKGYKNFWWIHDSEKQIMTARGIYGQALYIDRSNNTVVATFGSAKTASNATRETHKAKMDAIQTIVENLD